jgi:hypothetical protein
MEQADMGVDTPDHLTVQFQHKAQHPMRRRVLRSKIDREIAERSFGHACLVSPLGQTPGIFTGSVDALIGPHFVPDSQEPFVTLWFGSWKAREMAPAGVAWKQIRRKQDVRTRKLIQR